MGIETGCRKAKNSIMSRYFPKYDNEASNTNNAESNEKRSSPSPYVEMPSPLFSFHFLSFYGD
jgi:hypothetical protein